MGSTDNMFRTWRFDVEGKLKVGRNELHIVFASPTLKGREEMERYGLRLPADNDQSVRGRWEMTGLACTLVRLLTIMVGIGGLVW